MNEKTYLSNCNVIRRNEPIRSFHLSAVNEQRESLTDLATVSNTRSEKATRLERGIRDIEGAWQTKEMEVCLIDQLRPTEC